MKRLPTLLPLCSLAAAGCLLFPPAASGYVLLGGGLSLAGRHVRVFDNFSDTTANNNTTPHAQFPGYTGVELAIWKAIVEWGSVAHGNGSGDSTQSTLGNGGANFDASWQGNALEIGGSNENTLSTISGSDGGVLAYTESGADGFRIRFYEGWTWDDGPGSSISGMDVQGIATHEYGHALGLGHSANSSATMFFAAIGNGVADRSIESDDIAGVQAIYGPKAANKPLITAVGASSGNVTITGSNFSPTGNEVWFTRKTPAGSGVPIKVVGVSSNGSSITVAAPYLAGRGDVLVRNNGTAYANLSNAFPVDPGNTSANNLPNIVELSPAAVPSLTPDGLTVTIRGVNLGNASGVSVDGVALVNLGFNEQYHVVDENSITFAMPLVNHLGNVDVLVSTPFGSSSRALAVFAPEPPALDMKSSFPEAIFNVQGLDITVAGQPADLCVLIGSTELLPSEVPGIVSFGIGNAFSSIVPLDNKLLDPVKGWRSFHYPLNLPNATLFYLQAATISTANPVFPMKVTNIQTGLVAF